jgi:monothiol glutaredoxin
MKEEDSFAERTTYGSLTSLLNTMSKPNIIAYLKPTCGWSNGVRAVLRKYDLPYEDRDIVNSPLQRQEMIQKTGQTMSPCVEVDGHMLADISGEEVEAYMLAKGIVQPNDKSPDAPTHCACSH